MASRAIQDMTEDDELRALLTDREREILAGEADVTESYYYRVVSKVRKKIQRLSEDTELINEYHDKLADELSEAVCEGDETDEH